MGSSSDDLLGAFIDVAEALTHAALTDAAESLAATAQPRGELARTAPRRAPAVADWVDAYKSGRRHLGPMPRSVAEEACAILRAENFERVSVEIRPTGCFLYGPST